MQTALASTALLMGLVGGPHCVVMCGAACAGIGRAATPHGPRALGLFQAGRLLSYSAMGGLAAASMQGLGWLGTASAALRPAWTLLHLAAFALGAALLLQARQPAWVEQAGRAVWRRLRTRLPLRSAAFWMGAAWALMPCGLLQSALMVAALTGRPADGAQAMALFAVGSALSLWAAPWLLLRVPAMARGAASSSPWSLPQCSMRLAGLALAASSAWALWHGLVEQQAPWCVSP